ncbi:MAG: hypothetical protein ACF8PN_06725 [Phycisphaerales bacterium]
MATQGERELKLREIAADGFGPLRAFTLQFRYRVPAPKERQDDPIEYHIKSLLEHADSSQTFARELDRALDLLPDDEYQTLLNERIAHASERSADASETSAGAAKRSADAAEVSAQASRASATSSWIAVIIGGIAALVSIVSLVLERCGGRP